VALLSAGGVPVVKELVLQGSDYYYPIEFGNIGQKMKVGVFVQFETASRRASACDAEKAWCASTRRTARVTPSRRARMRSTHAEERERAA